MGIRRGYGDEKKGGESERRGGGRGRTKRGRKRTGSGRTKRGWKRIGRGDDGKGKKMGRGDMRKRSRKERREQKKRKQRGENEDEEQKTPMRGIGIPMNPTTNPTTNPTAKNKDKSGTLKKEKNKTHIRPRPRRIHNPTLQHVRRRAHGSSHRTRRKARSKVAQDVILEYMGFDQFRFEKVVPND